MNNFSFDKLARQSPKGIVINYGVLLYKLAKSFWIFIPLLFSKNEERGFSYFLSLIGIVASVLLVVAIIQYIFFKFKIENNHFVLHKGMIFRKKISIPLDRIQSVNFKQNLIHQLINITQIEIQTAGAKDAEVEIKAISREKAEALKRLLQPEVLSESESEIMEEIATPKEEKIYGLSILELFKVSISENHIRSFFWIIALVFSFGYQLGDVVKEWNFADELVQFIYVNQSKITSSLAVLAVVFVVGLIISVIVSFVRVFLRHFDQKVIKRDDGIQVSEGMFTKREDVLKIKKVQYTLSETNPVKQWLGIQTIRIKQAGSAKIKQKKQVALVGVKQEFATKLKQMFFGVNLLREELDNEDSQIFKPAKYYIFKMTVRTIFFLLVLNGFMFVNQFSLVNWLVCDVLLVLLSIWMILLKYKKAYVQFDGKMLYIGGGKIGTITKMMEFFKTQNITLSQSFIQKRRGVATLKLQTASGVLIMPCLHQEEAKLIKQRIIKEVENITRDWI